MNVLIVKRRVLLCLCNDLTLKIHESNHFSYKLILAGNLVRRAVLILLTTLNLSFISILFFTRIPMRFRTTFKQRRELL